MLFFYTHVLTITQYISVLAVVLLLPACSGSRKYFKAAEKLEKQGLVQEAAEYYLEALQRKATSVDAKIKLKEVGQKHVSNLSSEFFRNYNTQQTESSLQTFERLKEFTDRTQSLGVVLDYPRSYADDYQKAVDSYCSKNYSQATLLVSRKKYYEALEFIHKVEKYKPSYRNIKQLDIIATCEPLYQSAISNLENKNYQGALALLSQIRVKSEDYKDSKDLYKMASAQQSRSFILFEPKVSSDPVVQQIKEQLYNNFTETTRQRFKSVTVINNSPFQQAPSNTDLNSATNVDLIQAIRKATGADYFFVYDILNKKETNSGLSKRPAKAYQEINTRVNDSTVTTEYKVVNYSIVKSTRTFSYDFRCKLINAYSNQVISSQTQTLRADDVIEYNEFARKFTGNINTLFPYNPQQTSPLARYNAKSWRSLFSARSTHKSFDELRNEAINQATSIFSSVAGNMK